MRKDIQYRRFYDCYREIAQALPAQSPGSVSNAVITLQTLVQRGIKETIGRGCRD